MDGMKIPVGIDDFAEIIRKGFYYVDKTGLIKELLENWGEVNIFTRPRRFGKTLNMSMLQRFFEINTDKGLFDGLAIAKETRLCEKYMGQYPVISISLHAVEGNNYKMARFNLCAVIRDEARRFLFLLDDDRLSETDKNLYMELIYRGDERNQMSESTLVRSLKTLTGLLYKYYGKQVIVLIDEYDVPLAKAYKAGYYTEMAETIRRLYNVALKSNPSLYFAVMTGCLCVSLNGTSTEGHALSLERWSAFPILNNAKMFTLLNARCDEFFGFTDEEVRDILDFYGLSEYYDLTRKWYYGYRVGNASIYNPWDIVNWCNQLLTSPNKVPRNYWVNTSGNEELRTFIRCMSNGVSRTQLERLVSGQTVRKEIREQLTYDSMYDSIEGMWNLLFAAGYFTHDGNLSGNVVRLTIPNEEVRVIFRDFILTLFEEDVARNRESISLFCRALTVGNVTEVERLFTGVIAHTIGIRDTAVRKEFKESFYHGIFLKILASMDRWSVDSYIDCCPVSVQECPLGPLQRGCYDIAIEIEDESIGIIIEVKYAENEDFDAVCRKAMNQIQEHDYSSILREDDMQTILKYGIACYKKTCKVVLESEIQSKPVVK